MTAHVEQAIERYFRGEIHAVEERDALFGHLDRCPLCRASFDSHSTAHRLLAQKPFGAAELESMLPALLDGASPRLAPGSLRWLRWLGPLVASAGAAVLFFLSPSGLSIKGGSHSGAAIVEALCFDAQMAVTAHLKESGRCPAPGYVKLLFASPSTVPALTVVVLAKDEVRLDLHLKQPEPRSVLADYAKLEPQEVLRVIAVAGDRDTPLALAKQAPEVLSISGESP
ncbi:MAG: hypothetical protein U1E65_26030 [Myxococcota bacterium]